ncbi:hypothetical protein HDV05_005348 [Chytridiales sp. JEL 0842]|nr:hypothetical protein HDV05_005348 [Chytridiales sp. JEL 0842]
MPELTVGFQYKDLTDSKEEDYSKHEAFESARDALTSVVNLMEGIVRDMKTLGITANMKKVSALTNTESKELLEKVECFEKELMLKQEIAKQLYSVNDRNEAMFYLAAWMQEPYL